jgi:DNA-binding MarR family transcriptional regulator
MATSATRDAGAEPPVTDVEAAREAWRLIQRLSGEMKKRFMDLAREFELSPPQFWTIRHLVEPQTMSELAGTLLCDNSNVTGIIDRLEQRSLVARTPSPGDRRVKLLVLTADGERMRRKVEKVMDEPPAWLAGLGAADQRTLRDILARAEAEDPRAR